MFKYLRSRIVGLITELKRSNLRPYCLMGDCVRMFIHRETQKTWINLDGSYVLLPDWYIEKESQEKNV